MIPAQPRVRSRHPPRSVTPLFQRWNSDFKAALPKKVPASLAAELLEELRIVSGNRQWEKQIKLHGRDEVFSRET